MIHCILSLIFIVILYDVWAINKIHKPGSSGKLSLGGFDKVTYDLTKAVPVFNEFNLKYGNKYKNNIVKTNVFNIFCENLRKINHLNEVVSSAIFMINEFTSMTMKDFTEQYTGYNSAAAALTRDNVTRFEYDPKFRYSENRDFRDGGLLMVRHQKRCANSYIHSAVGKSLFYSVIQKI